MYFFFEEDKLEHFAKQYDEITPDKEIEFFVTMKDAFLLSFEKALNYYQFPKMITKELMMFKIIKNIDFKKLFENIKIINKKIKNIPCDIYHTL